MKKKPECPECHETKTVKYISYGMPSRMPTEEDDWVTGGCIIDFDSPQHYCTACDLEFNVKQHD